MKRIFTEYVRSLAADIEPTEEDFDAVWKKLGDALRHKMVERSLWGAPPSYLGVCGSNSWSEKDAFEELLCDCYSFSFVHRLSGLAALLEKFAAAQRVCRHWARHLQRFPGGRYAKEVADRRRRLDELVGRGRPDVATAHQIIRESARYNVSGRVRDFNSPHIGLELLASSRDWCCRVSARPARAADPPQTMPGLDVRGSWLLDLRETGRPTIIRTPDNRPLRSRVRYRVDEATGAVRWYELEVGRPDTVSIAVTFAFDAAMGEWLPAGMVETFGVESEEERGEGRAQYVNWRRFAVETRLLPVP